MSQAELGIKPEDAISFWWKSDESNILRQLARIILCIPAGYVHSKRLLRAARRAALLPDDAKKFRFSYNYNNFKFVVANEKEEKINNLKITAEKKEKK